jgi:hypothetical protein
MRKATARHAARHAADAVTVARLAIVFACAGALILAGQPLPL